MVDVAEHHGIAVDEHHLVIRRRVDVPGHRMFARLRIRDELVRGPDLFRHAHIHLAHALARDHVERQRRVVENEDVAGEARAQQRRHEHLGEIAMTGLSGGIERECVNEISAHARRGLQIEDVEQHRLRVAEKSVQVEAEHEPQFLVEILAAGEMHEARCEIRLRTRVVGKRCRDLFARE